VEETRKHKKGSHDFNSTAFRIEQQVTNELQVAETVVPPLITKNPHAVALGRLGGLKGGKARAEKLSLQQRRDIARKAAEARWRKNG
jgi:hypothetical protein